MSTMNAFFAPLVLSVVFAGCSAAQPFAGFEQVYDQLSFDQPVLLTHVPGDSERLFVVEQTGQIQVFNQQPEVASSSVFFDINAATDNRFLSGGEQGLLGLAFHPAFQSNGWFYVNYTAAEPRRTVIARYRIASDNSNLTDYSSEQVLLEINQAYSNHNGGMIAFGDDGKLYIGMGDGGSAGDPGNRAQDGQSLLGKMLRLNDDGSVPADNPFVGHENVRDEIWALGLRNPWRFSFDRDNGTLWAGDVGQNEVEEIDRIVRGGNYGWRWYEGSQPYNPDDRTASVSVIDPVHEYTHKDGQSVTGGVVYRGQQFPALAGWYIFGDFVSGNTWALNTQNQELRTLEKLPNPSSFGEDADGEVYATTYSGDLYRLVVRSE